MAAAIKLKPRLKGLPKAKAPKARRAPSLQRKVWTGAKKKLGVSPLQLALPGVASQIL